MADERKTQTTPQAPVHHGGAHHGPGDGLTPSETIQAFLGRLRDSGWFTYKLLGIVVIIVVTILIWRYIAGIRGSASSREWIALDQASTVAELERIANKDPNSYAGRTALLFLTRNSLDRGISGMNTMRQEDRQAAIDELEKARQNFKKLSEVFEKDPIQYPECLWGLAKSEQALIGVPKKDNPLAHRGEVTEAVKAFEKTAEAAGDTPLGKAAKEQAAYLNKNSNEITQLQSNLYKPFSTDMPDDDIHKRLRPSGGFPGPSLPGFPGGPDLNLPTPTPPAPPEPKADPAPATPDPKVEIPTPKVEPAPAPAPPK